MKRIGFVVILLFVLSVLPISALAEPKETVTAPFDVRKLADWKAIHIEKPGGLGNLLYVFVMNPDLESSIRVIWVEVLVDYLADVPASMITSFAYEQDEVLYYFGEGTAYKGSADTGEFRDYLKEYFEKAYKKFNKLVKAVVNHPRAVLITEYGTLEEEVRRIAREDRR